MTNQELTEKLTALQATLPENLRAALDVAQIAECNGRELKAIADPATALVGPNLITRADVIAAYAANPAMQLINTLLHVFIQAANAQIPQAFRTTPVNVFGDANNRLDPLNFHSSASTSASGEACVERHCTTVFGLRACFPPMEVCASGGASAGLRTLSGLSSARISDISVTENPSMQGSIATVKASLGLTAGWLSASGFAEAHGGPFGINIPVSASGSAQLSSVRANAAAVFTMDLSKPAVTAIALSNLAVNYGSLTINISGLGPFNSLLGPLVDGLKSIVQQFFNVNGAISNALQGVLQSQLNALVK